MENIPIIIQQSVKEEKGGGLRTGHRAMGLAPPTDQSRPGFSDPHQGPFHPNTSPTPTQHTAPRVRDL